MNKNMWRLLVLSVFLFINYTQSVAQDTSQHGSLMMVAPDGYRVYLNGELKGFTSDEQDGIFIPKLNVGSYAVELRKGSKTVFTSSIQINSGKITEEYFEPEQTNDISTIRTYGYYRVWVTNTLNDNYGRFKSNVYGMNALAFRSDGSFVLMEDFFGQNKAEYRLRDKILSNTRDYQNNVYSGKTYTIPILKYWVGSYSIEGNKLNLDYDEGTSTVLTILDDESTMLKIGSTEYIWVED